MTTPGWLGYDWFKLIVAAILAALLLIFGLNRGTVAATPAPAAGATTAPAAAISAPRLPTLGSPAAGAALATGATRFSGTGEPGATVRVTIDGQPAGTATVGSDSTWQLDATLDTPGTRNVTVETVDAAGAKLNAAAPVMLTVAAPTAAAVAAAATTVPTAAATTAPTAPTAVDAQPPTLVLPTGAITAGAITLAGTGTPAAQVEVLANGQSLGTATVGSDGAWSLPTTLPAGDYDLSVQTAGNAATASTPVTLTVAETTAPGTTPAATPAATPATGGALAISAPADGAQIASGPFTMSGTGPVGSNIEVLDGDKVVGTTTVGSDSTWQLELPAPQGTAAYSVRPAGSTDPATTATRVTAGTITTCATIAVGCNAWVTREGGLPLRLRSGPGTSNAIITRLPVGTQMLLNEGPQAANGFNWYKVKTIGGTEGWVAGEQVRLQPD